MDILEFLIPVAVALLILATAITLAVLTIIAWVRSRRLGELTRRIERLERRLEQLLASGAPALRPRGRSRRIERESVQS